MKFLITFLAGLAFCSATNQAFRSDHVQYAIRAGQVPMRGVNLGGWLVTESWINPADSIWRGVNPATAAQGEMAVMKELGHAVGDPKFQTHWDTFITEADIQEIANSSLNAMRVPVGWWIVGFDNHDVSGKEEWKTFAPGGLAYLDRLINVWALRHNVAVLVDLHAAKGSQNGNDHSAPPEPGTVYWDKYQENINTTLDVVTFLAARYRNSSAFLGIGLLNEPTTVDRQKLKDYYGTAIQRIRDTGNDCYLMHDPILFEQNQGTAGNWESFTPVPPFRNMWHDWHKYLIWGYEGQTGEWVITQGVEGIANDIARWTGNDLVMGEWCLATVSPYVDGPPTKINDSQMIRFATNMFNTLKAMKGGWTFWTWKQGTGAPRGEGEGGWSFRDLLRDGIVKPSMWQ